MLKTYYKLPRVDQPIEVRIVDFLSGDRVRIEPVDPCLFPFVSHGSEHATYMERRTVVATSAVIIADEVEFGSLEWFKKIPEIDYEN